MIVWAGVRIRIFLSGKLIQFNKEEKTDYQCNAICLDVGQEIFAAKVNLFLKLMQGF